jgi:formylglycine-generating enzyme required for sulfatase activity
MVVLDAFLIDRTEITGRQYATFLAHVNRLGAAPFLHTEDDAPALRPAGWESDEPPRGAEDLPVKGVNWYSAYAYARWACGSLPTEAQWERAAAGPFGTACPWGDAFDATRCRAGAPGPVRADSMPGGESFYGLLHTCGNVREWCEDRFDPRWYSRGPRRNPRGPSRHKHRALRGGSYASEPEALWLQVREHLPPSSAPEDAGFRVAWRWTGLAGP